MKKLLIIDDSKTILAKLQYIAEQSGKFVVATAASYAEAKVLIKKNNFYAAIVDLNLPDCLEGDAVTLTTSNRIASIVLTGQYSPGLLKKIKRHPIVDFIVKSDDASILSAVFAAESLLNFENEKVLFVCREKNESVIKYLNVLKLDVSIAETAKQAMSIYEQDKTYKIVITDYKLPDLDGVSLIQNLRLLKAPVTPVFIGVHDEGSINTRLLFLKSGAQNFFTKPLIHEELYSVLANALYMGSQECILKRYIKTVDKYVITSETDLTGKITYVSEAFCEISGYKPEDLIGKSHSIVRHPDMPESLYENLWSTISLGKSWSGEVKNKKKNGNYYWVSVNIDPIVDQLGNVTGYRAIRQDITDKKRVEELSLTDAMTGLYNRRHYNQIFPNLLSIGQRDHKPVAMILLDVDHFKQYNDTYGHQKGDEVLIAIAGSLKYLCQRGSDTAFRLGGEEFGVLSFNANVEQIEFFANKIRQEIEALKIPHQHNSASEFVTASFGVISTNSEQQLSMDKLYSLADDALYQSKENGRNKVSQAQ